MAETTNVHENSSNILPNNKNYDSNANSSDNSPLKAESASISSETNGSFNNPIHSTDEEIQQNKPNNDMNNAMERLSFHEMRPINHSNSSRFPLHSNYPYYYQTAPPVYYNQNINQPETQAQLLAFTPPLMSLRFPDQHFQGQQRNSYFPTSHMQNHSFTQSSLPPKSKSETAVSQPEFYVDAFASNFSDKPTSNNKTKAKHVHFQEPEPITESKINSNDITFPQQSSTLSNDSYYSIPAHMYPSSRRFDQTNYSNYYPPNNGYYLPYHNMMMDQRFMTRPRGMNMMSTPPVWTPQAYYPDQQQQPVYNQHLYQPKQLYDPKKPRIPTTPDVYDSSRVIRNIPPKNKKKPKQTNSDVNSTLSPTESIPHPITILRKPCADSEFTILPSVKDRPVTPVKKETSTIPPIEECPDIQSTEDQTILSSIESPPVSDIKSVPVTTTILSIPSHELLSILQSANCISSLNEYAQKNKLTIDYDLSSISSSSSSSFTCIVSINDRQFPVSSPCSSKNEAQKLACDQALRILYRESCTNEQSSLEFSTIHDYIAHRSVSTFHELNVNELLLGRKTLACMLMITNKQFEQARVISIGTGNGCLDETSLSYADDGTALHDCHAEILARRGLIKFLFEQIKQSKDNNNNQSSIFEYNSTINKYQLRENITFHMYISSLPCGNAALKIPSNSIRYKQGQTEGTLLASTSSLNYPIKSCSDKIYRWNILGIQGGLLIHLIDKPIYFETITLACEPTFDHHHVKYSLNERLNEHFQSLPTPFLLNSPDINCPTIKSLQQERQVAKLQTSAFAWNITRPDRTELLEPMTGRLKTDRSMSSLSKQNLFEDFTNFMQANFPDDNSLSFTTYQQAKQLNQTYITVKNLISTAFQTGSSDTNISWLSKSDQLEQFSIQ